MILPFSLQDWDVCRMDLIWTLKLWITPPNKKSILTHSHEEEKNCLHTVPSIFKNKRVATRVSFIEVTLLQCCTFEQSSCIRETFLEDTMTQLAQNIIHNTSFFSSRNYTSCEFREQRIQVIFIWLKCIICNCVNAL